MMEWSIKTGASLRAEKFRKEETKRILEEANKGIQVKGKKGKGTRGRKRISNRIKNQGKILNHVTKLYVSSKRADSFDDCPN